MRITSTYVYTRGHQIVSELSCNPVASAVIIPGDILDTAYFSTRAFLSVAHKYHVTLNCNVSDG